MAASIQYCPPDHIRPNTYGILSWLYGSGWVVSSSQISAGVVAEGCISHHAIIIKNLMCWTQRAQSLNVQNPEKESVIDHDDR
jgi:hypothetical protein